MKLDSHVKFIDLRKPLTFVHEIYYAASLHVIDSKRAFSFGQGSRRAQCRARVLILLGTSPTAITATAFKDFVSMADTDPAPELET